MRHTLKIVTACRSWAASTFRTPQTDNRETTASYSVSKCSLTSSILLTDVNPGAECFGGVVVLDFSFTLGFFWGAGGPESQDASHESAVLRQKL